MGIGRTTWAGFVLTALQAAGGSIAGTVQDGETGAPLAGAMVSLPDLGRAALTDAEGRYLLPAVPAGPQHVLVRRIGYQPRTFHALVPAQGTLRITVALRAVPVTLRAIEVRAGVPVRNLDHADSAGLGDRSLSLAAVRNHPLLSEPDPLQALGGGQVVLRPESPGGLHVRGGSTDQLGYLLDGIPVLAPLHAGGSFSAWNPDALSRVSLITTSALPEFPAPHALSGTVAATTRPPSSQLLTQGALTTTQARLTVTGPIGPPGAGYLVSVRSAFPGLLGHSRDPAYLRGGSNDWLAKLEAPLLGGRFRALGYGNQNELTAAVDSMNTRRNEFDWEGWSLGGTWTGTIRGAGLKLLAWSASGDAEALWQATDSSSEFLGATRRESGLAARLELPGRATRTTVGIRTEWSRTGYRLSPASGPGESLALNARTPVSAAFLSHAHRLGASELELSIVGAIATGAVYLDPGIRFRWNPTGSLSVQAAYSRRHQFAQSLRNPESIVGNIFPVDLFLGAGPAVPVARSDLGLLGVEFHPAVGIRIGAETYARSLGSLALVAARDPGPFATTAIATGSGSARGVVLEASANGSRFGLVATYGLQRVRLRYGDSSYVPEHGATHTVDAGVIVFPSASSSLRLGVTGIMGRRTTGIQGAFEWEACNLLDRGCQFVGNPHDRAGPLGSTRLPGYFRVDLGFRKHWHWTMAGRDGQLGVFATVTNVLGWGNILTFAVDPSTGQRTAIGMRPRSPLVVGMDWRF